MPEISDDIPNPVKSHLDEIANRLWSFNATAMVGSGFSQNAEPDGETHESMPNWEMLGDIFYTKLHGHPPGDEARYLSVLKLAEQVQAAFGRCVLDCMLQSAIPDLQYKPSRLHSNLLSLPWKDIFTTNYDTLLERARSSVTLKHYQVVSTEKDLLQAIGRRIIKLHGSFPCPPFVITEEDYRLYPANHQPFVNTVRQSLLENTLCLIGFSGNDPNFLQWIGWMRDQVGREASPKIYLIGVFNAMSEADRRLLNARKIVTVDLSTFSKDPGIALGCFLSYLKGRRTRSLEWPTSTGSSHPSDNGDVNNELEKISTEWERQRRSYPGWVVLPKAKRQILWRHTQEWLTEVSNLSEEKIGAMDTPLDLDVAFELSWRLDKCLIPLTGKLPAFLEAVLNKYDEGGVPIPEQSQWNESSISEAIFAICLHLMRHYRVLGLEDEWENLRLRVHSKSEKLAPEFRARLQFEVVLQALYQFDQERAKQLLIEWQSDVYLPFWEAKRAAIMAELGEVSTAYSMLQASLSALRSQQSLKPVGNDYTLVSQESVVMLLLGAVEQGMEWSNSNERDSRLLERLSERWDELAQYKCNPRSEFESFSARLTQRGTDSLQNETISYGFDLGTRSRTFYFGFDEGAVTAYGFLRFIEDIGMPYHIQGMSFENNMVAKAVARVGPHSPHWAMVNLVRLGDSTAIDGLFNREYISSLNCDQVDSFFEIYLSVLEHTISVANQESLSAMKSYESIAKTLPEVFSRLAYKCSPRSRESLVRVLKNIYESNQRQLFEGIRNQASRLFDSMSIEERIRAISQVIDFAAPNIQSFPEEHNYLNPLAFIYLPEEVVGNAELEVPINKIDWLLDQLAEKGNDKDWLKVSLMWLSRHELLDEQQVLRFRSLFWEGIEAPDIPAVHGLYGFECMRVPPLDEMDIESQVKEHLKTKIRANTGRSSFDEVLEELRQSTALVNWLGDEVEEILDELIDWWGKNKIQLLLDAPTPLGHGSNRTRNTIWRIVSVLSELLNKLPINEVTNFREGKLHDFIADLDGQGIEIVRMEVAILQEQSTDRAKLLDRLSKKLQDNDQNKVTDALRGARLLASKIEGREAQAEFDHVRIKLTQGVEWRHRPALANRLKIISGLIRDHLWFLSGEAENSIIRGLEQIAVETMPINIIGNDEDGVISIRAAAASLAFEIHRRYQDSENEVPESIQEWQLICEDQNEFAEVINGWGHTSV